MIAEAFLICALAPAPWPFLDPLSVRAKLHTFADLVTLEEKYPDYRFGMAVESTPPPKEEGWEPTPWVFGVWRIYFRRSS